MKILIAVIAYNEEGNIEGVIEDLVANNFGYDIVVIDNGSLDNTALLCRKYNITVISHCVNTGGFNGAFLSYFMYAYAYNYDIVCQFDGDGQHSAAELPGITEPLVRGAADVVIGSRFIKKEGFQSYFFRRIGIRFFSFLLSMITGKKFTDITSGFRAYNRKIIEYFGYYSNFIINDVVHEFIIYTHYLGGKIIEVPVLMKQRNAGKSEYNIWNAVFFPIKSIISIFGSILRKRQIQNKARYLQ